MPASNVGHTFNHSLGSDIGPQNTGVSSLDYDVDRVIGRDAEKRWSLYERRQRRKQEVMSETGVSSKDLSIVPQGEGYDYRVMSSEEKKTIRNTRAFHNLTMGLSKSKDRYKVLKELSEKERAE